MKVIIGDAGYLFMGGDDSNDLLSQHRGLTRLDDDLLEIRKSHLGRRAFLEKTASARYLHIISPNKETVGRDLMPPDVVFEEFGPVPVRQYLKKFPDADRETFYQPTVLNRFLEDRLYYFTDTHWTFRGAKRYLEHALQWAGLEERAETLIELPLRQVDLPFVGDLARHIDHPGETQDFILPAHPKARVAFSNEIANEGRVFHYLNPMADGRVLVIMDSTGSWILQFLPELFAEVLAVHTADLDLGAVAAFRPDFLMQIQCERFFPRIPRNDADWTVMIADNETQKNAPRSGIPYLRKLGLLQP